MVENEPLKLGAGLGKGGLTAIPKGTLMVVCFNGFCFLTDDALHRFL